MVSVTGLPRAVKSLLGRGFMFIATAQPAPHGVRSQVTSIFQLRYPIYVRFMTDIV